jgi:hypothetical protein
MKKIKNILKEVIIGVKLSDYYYKNVSQHPKF